ncbi:MAG: hypothetical protein A2401_00165 [Candidatus Staskawiczbacteria bacterium RIFOXYC1_FULL_38_18]|uniref:Uncharacterized protein n=1 Tax=Candidatus Staskawiczbacteria bacterium RIFOXYC1_FULL_38_18 TaxID=1802229 RepID=A0A1G2J9E5_9BACT|nr:MAG: hypothetical protein A2401_00165 [Candidatus Staskawiczbacteria bacterium RIFOXYC1_FULL_38_18]
MDSETKQCQNCKKDFTIEPDDFAFYEKIKVPSPTWCPDCRMMRRFIWASNRILYRQKFDSGEEGITFYPLGNQHKIYSQEKWWSDDWDPKSYGKEYDFSKSFFEQWLDLFREVPHPTLYTAHATMIDSPYCNGASELKNCYLCFRSDYSENCAYTNTMSRLKDCFDVAFINDSELCYEVVNSNKCYRAFWSQDCDDSHDIWFSKDLTGCFDCMGCINLRNKQYHILNQPYTKEEYAIKVKELNFGSLEKINDFRKKVQELFLTQPRRQFHGRKNVNVVGDYIFNSKNVHDTYMGGNLEDVRYSQLLKSGPARDAYDYTMFGMTSELVYESVWVGLTIRNIKFGFWNYGAHDLEYSFGCHGSGNLFGCVGIRNSEYCILNKQYTKEEYLDLVEKIKKQMMDVPYVDLKKNEYRYGEFFPAEFSPWAYNETSAYEFFPISKEEVVNRGFVWRDDDSRGYESATVSVPDDIKDVTDEILSGILKCDICGKNYKLIKMELEFYRRMNVLIPRQCPLCRDRARIGQLNPIKIFLRNCAKCNKEIETSYAPDRPEIVYCEQCYQQEVA